MSEKCNEVVCIINELLYLRLMLSQIFVMSDLFISAATLL